jgi:CRP-like cAMP-binding protein
MPSVARPRSGAAIVRYKHGDSVYARGDESAHVMCIKSGTVKVSAVSATGAEAVVAVLGRGDFFGEQCLAGERRRTGTATAMAPSAILLVTKERMAALLRTRQTLSGHFVAGVLTRNRRMEQDLLCRIFHSSEGRLARELLRLARYGQSDAPLRRLPAMSVQTLAGMIGATPAQVDAALNRFSRLGYINHGQGPSLIVHHRLLRVVLDD